MWLPATYLSSLPYSCRGTLTNRFDVLAADNTWTAEDQRSCGDSMLIRRLDMWARWATARWRVLPDFLIIGTIRGGTTTLYRLLAEHPCVIPAARKEVHFFDQHYDRGFNWYRLFFPTASRVRRLQGRRGGRVLTGESSPSYLMNPVVPERVAQAVPDARLIVLLRNPADRAFSHYHFRRRCRNETNESLESCLLDDDRRVAWTHQQLTDRGTALFTNCYRWLGMYAVGLRRWFEVFPRNQVVVLRSEDLYADPKSQFEGVLDFLGLPSWTPRAFDAHNVGSYEPMSKELAQELRDFYAWHNRELEELVGLSFNWD
jgi:hypothetical protein